MPEPPAPPLERIVGRETPRSIVDLALHRDPNRPPSVDHVLPPAPRVRLTRRTTSLPLPVPGRDWEKVVCGTKPLYRTYSGHWRDRFARLVPEGEELPRPTVLYTIHQGRRYDYRLGVLLGYRQEPLGAISRGDVLAEGFDHVNHFKRYWKVRYPRFGWRPGDLVSVVEVRPWEEQDDEEQGAWLLRRLYGDWL